MGGTGARSLVCGWASAAVAGEAARPNTVRIRLAIEIPRRDTISFSNLPFAAWGAEKLWGYEEIGSPKLTRINADDKLSLICVDLRSFMVVISGAEAQAPPKGI
jgi:hypothetical protein